MDGRGHIYQPVLPQALSPPVRAHLLHPSLALRMGPFNLVPPSGPLETGTEQSPEGGGRAPASETPAGGVQTRKHGLVLPEALDGQSAPPSARPANGAPSGVIWPWACPELLSLWEDILSAHLTFLSPLCLNSANSIWVQFTLLAGKTPYFLASFLL